jgi:hypothetical protein
MLAANVTGQQYMYDAAYQPDLDKVLAAHGIAISRYFTGPNPAFVWKRVTPQQVTDTLGKGLGMVCNTEGSADPLSAADAAGVTYKEYGKLLAQWGLTDLVRCGIPAGIGVADYFSVDVYTDPSRYPDVRDMFDGINEVIPRAGYLTKVYSQGGLIDYLCAQHRVDGKQWLAAPTSWPGYKEALAGPNLAMVQLVGSPVAATDQNKILDPYAIGAYWPDGSPYGGEVPLTDDDVKKIWAYALTPPAGGASISAGLRLAEVDQHVAKLTTASSGNVWDENVTGPSGQVSAARNRLGNIDKSTGVDIPTALASIQKALADLAAAVAALEPAPPASPVNYTMTGQLTPQQGPTP